MSADNPRSAPIADAPSTQPAELARLARAAELGVARLPWDDTSHRRRCVLCRDLADELDEIEAAYLSWQPASQIAEAHGCTVAQLRAHATAYLWDLRRCAETAPAYSKLIEAGIEAAQSGQATPAHALAALRDLHRAARRAAGPRHGDEESGTAETIETSSGAVVISYEERVRRTRARLADGADPLRLARELARRGEIGKPGEAAGDDERDPLDVELDQLPEELPDAADRRARALLDLGDGTDRTRKRAARRLVRAASRAAEGDPR